MPNDREIAQNVQKKYYGNPQGLAQYLVSICLNQTGVVREVFYILDRFSTFDVGYRFLNLMTTATLLKLTNGKSGKAFCEVLLSWLLNPEPLRGSEPVAPGIDAVIELKRLKDAIDNSNPKDGENPYYTIDAGINLEVDAIATLDKIAPLYYAKVGEKFNVNSGTRDSYRQADAMYNVYINGDKTLHLYGNRKVANELIAIIQKGESKAITVQKMTDLIQKYFEQKIYMSDHQKAGAIDISIVGDVGVPRMTAPKQKIMMEIATKVTGFSALLEKSPPHIHIKFKE